MSVLSVAAPLPTFDFGSAVGAVVGGPVGGLLAGVGLLQQVAGNVVAGSVQDLLTGIWAAGLWLTGFLFGIVDEFTTPDLSADGVMSKVYPTTFAIGLALALVIAFLQIGFAVWQRDGKGLGRLLVGVCQFLGAWAGMVAVAAALTVSTSGLTKSILQVGFGAPSFASLHLFTAATVRDAVDTATAVVLAVCGFLLIVSAIGYLMMMLVRAAALMILTATSPIAAAGLLSEGTAAWFWKALRWFIAALMMGPLSALVLAIGKLLLDGVLSGAGQDTEAAVGAAVVGTVVVLVGAFCPLLLFRLLAFVDPGTSTGASFRASMDAAGGLGGLLGGRGGSTDAGSGAATGQASDGTSQGESSAQESGRSRLAGAFGALGTTGAAVASNVAAFGTDVLSSAGIGHQQPYFGHPSPMPRSTGSGGGQATRSGQDSGSDPQSPQRGPDSRGADGAGPTGAPPTAGSAPTPPPPPGPPPPPSPGSSGGSGGGPGGGKPGGGPPAPAGGGGAGGGAEAAAVVAV